MQASGASRVKEEIRSNWSQTTIFDNLGLTVKILNERISLERTWLLNIGGQANVRPVISAPLRHKWNFDEEQACRYRI